MINFRFGLIPGLNTQAVAQYPAQAFEIIAREFRLPVIFIIYITGITATVWHFANGLWLFAVDWGIVGGERAQRLTVYTCIAFGAVLLIVGINSAVAFIRPGGLF